MIFDVNDFDETLPGPFEWDLKRLAASIEVAARSRGFDEPLCRKLVGLSSKGYREAIREFGAMRNLDVWYSRLDADTLIGAVGVRGQPRHDRADSSSGWRRPGARTTSRRWPS